MRRAGGIGLLTGFAVAMGLATPFDSPSGLAQDRLAAESRPFDSRLALAQGRQGGPSRGPRHATAKPYTTWQSYAGGAHSSQYSALDQINTKNVAKLEVAWSVPITGSSIFNPLVVDGVMYVPVGGGALAAIDAATGKEIWRKEGVAPSGARGMNYWESPDRSDRRFIYLQRGDVIAVNAALATTSTAAIARATTCSPTRSSRSTHAPASGSGISSSFTTTSGTGTFRSRPSC